MLSWWEVLAGQKTKLEQGGGGGEVITIMVLHHDSSAGSLRGFLDLGHRLGSHYYPTVNCLPVQLNRKRFVCVCVICGQIIARVMVGELLWVCSRTHADSHPNLARNSPHKKDVKWYTILYNVHIMMYILSVLHTGQGAESSARGSKVMASNRSRSQWRKPSLFAWLREKQNKKRDSAEKAYNILHLVLLFLLYTPKPEAKQTMHWLVSPMMILVELYLTLIVMRCGDQWAIMLVHMLLQENFQKKVKEIICSAAEKACWGMGSYCQVFRG